jgi:hypothetical protein
MTSPRLLVWDYSYLCIIRNLRDMYCLWSGSLGEESNGLNMLTEKMRGGNSV